ncbi:MAG: alpha/beta fold hydrolase [bacterium]|nr:alpha/beta fold hydrolase [bacterium]
MNQRNCRIFDFRVAIAGLLVWTMGLSSCAFNKTFFPTEKQGTAVLVTNPRAQEFTLTADDGTHISHLLLKPEGESLAAIFFLHGSGGRALNWLSSAEVLVNRGFTVLMMDYRGFGSSEGTASHRTALHDAKHALAWLGEREEKIILFGHSYGGQLAIKLAHGDQDLVTALVTEGAFTSHNDIATWTTPAWARPFTKLAVRSPWKAKDLIGAINVPKLVVHSVDDEMVPFWMGEKLFQLAAEPKQFWQTTGPHTCSINRYGDEYVQRIKDLLGEPSDAALVKY